MAQYLFNDNTNCFNNTNSFTKVWNNCTIADDRSQILSWLSPLEPKLRHKDIRERRVKYVGEWIFQTEEFRSWRADSGEDESSNAVLFCYGDPGVGKTYISSLVIDRLCDEAKGQNLTVACFYFNFTTQKEESSTNMLGALLKQAVNGLGEIPGDIVEAYEEQKKVIGGRGPQLGDIVKMLQTTSSEKRTFICIDALDECAAGDRVKLLYSLNRILQKSPGTRIFVTGRPHIRVEIGKHISGIMTSVSITPRRDDVVRYIRTRLDEDISPDVMDRSLEADILRKIPEDVSEIFLLVSLNLDAILQEATIHRRRQKLGAITHGFGLGDAYDATLGRIKGQGGQKSGLGMATLMWLSHSERPLRSGELCHALAVEIGSSDLNADNVPSIGTVLASCQGLVVVDKEASTVRLIHVTLHEYLRDYVELFSAAHSIMAETCLSYLNSQQVKALSASPFPDIQSTPFLEYSSQYWGIHAKRELSDCAKSLALKLFDDYKDHISTKILLKARKPHSRTVGFDKPSLFSGLHCASVFGIAEIVAGLVEVEGCKIGQPDCTGNTPLTWAALGGHEQVMEMLLGRNDVKPDEHYKYGETPLSCAAYNGHEGVVKMLLGRDDVNPSRPDNNGRTPLHAAAYNGHIKLVKMLLGRDEVNSGQRDINGRTPLHAAAHSGHGGVVKILLGRGDVNPGQRDNGGGTPLSSAAYNGHEKLVKILLGRGEVRPDQPDINGRTPLHAAAHNGYDEVVKILLGRGDVKSDKADAEGATPIRWAAQNGHEGVVKTLLGQDDVNPDQPDNNGQTPLGSAARNGHQRVVKMLLARDDVNPDGPDITGQTPLSGASCNGHEGVVKILLAQNHVNPDKPDNNGETPLHRAAWNGHEGVVTMLLARAGVDPNRPDKLGKTPLWWATKRGLMGVIALLQPLASPALRTA